MSIIISILVFVSYAIVARVLFGKFKSYSVTWYKMKTYLYSRNGKEVYFRWFQLWIFTLSILSYFIVSPIVESWIATISSFLLALVGFIPNVKNKEYSPWHIASAVLYFAVTIFSLSAFVVHGWAVFGFWVLLIVILMSFSERYILFIELVSFIVIIILVCLSKFTPYFFKGFFNL